MLVSEQTNLSLAAVLCNGRASAQFTITKEAPATDVCFHSLLQLSQ